MQTQAVGSRRRRLGVLGGMGPLATADFYTRLVRATPAATDQEHLAVVIMGDPQIPDRSEAIMRGATRPVLEALLARLGDLERAGVDAIAIPCNTAHRWLPELTSRTDRPFLAMPMAVAEALAKAPGRSSVEQKTAMLLGTRGTLVSHVYQDALTARDIRIVPTPEHVQELVDNTIRAVKSGQLTTGCHLLRSAVQLACSLTRPTAFILACTELPLVAPTDNERDFLYIDATAELVRSCLRWAAAEQGKARTYPCALS